jgi:hypothetical protein
MDSKVAIARGIADLDCDSAVKECLMALFNIELLASAGEPSTKASYVKEIEKRSAAVPSDLEDDQQ